MDSFPPFFTHIPGEACEAECVIDIVEEHDARRQVPRKPYKLEILDENSKSARVNFEFPQRPS